MLKLSPERRDRFIKLTQRLLRLEKELNRVYISFEKPWWKIFFARPGKVSILLFTSILQNIFGVLQPLLLGVFISTQSWVWGILVFGMMFSGIVLGAINFYTYQTMTSSIQLSLDQAAAKFFLTVDPEYHVTKSTGQITSKLSATGREFMMLFSNLFFSIIPMVVSYITVIITLLRYDLLLGGVAALAFLIMTGISSLGNIFISTNITPQWIEGRDTWASKRIENLTQIWLIRSTFSTKDALDSNNQIAKKAFKIRIAMNLLYDALYQSVIFIYVGSVIFVSLMSIQLMNQGSISSPVAIALVLTYMNGTQSILRIGNVITQTAEGLENISDLWDFIRNFGSQTYPVLPEDNDSNL